VIKSRAVEYREGETTLEGHVVWDDAPKEKRPGVLVVPEWYGINNFTLDRCRTLAVAGYSAFAVDVYGKGIRPAAFADAQSTSKQYYDDRPLLRRRGYAALNAFRDQPMVDGSKIAGIGYCFGGITLLELARDGADLTGVVCFHTQLMTSMPAKPGAVKAKVLVLHGAYDPVVPQQEIDDFMKEMRAARVDWQMMYYGNAVHSYTNPSWPPDPTNTKTTAYNELVDRRSWGHMEQFLREVL
jgi:dienelactone hydrolase